MLAWSENAIAADASMGPLFSERELEEFLKYPPSSRKRKIKQRFIERISMPPYSTMSGYDKYKYIEEQIKPIKNNKGCFGGGCFGMILGGFISAAIGGPAGSILFLFIIAGGAYIGDQTTKPKQALILPLLELELAKNKPKYIEEVEARGAIASKNAKAAEVEVKNKKEKAETESKRIFEMIQKEPKRIAELFPSYREYAVIVINTAHPNQDEVNAAASAKEFGNAMMVGLFGIYGIHISHQNTQDLQI